LHFCRSIHHVGVPKKIVRVAASAMDFVGGYDVIIQADPPEGHMAGPKALLESLP
jgi:hypothetical protein